MKILKGFLNFAGIVLAVILSILLLVALIVTPIISSATDMINPKTLQKVFASIDYEQILASSDSGVEIDEDGSGLPNSTIQGLMKTEIIKEMLELYIQDATTVLSGENKEKEYTPTAIKGILTENIDEVTDIAFELLKEEDPQITKEELKTQMLSDIDQISEDLSKLLPDTEELIDVDSMDEETLNVLRTFATGGFKLYIFGAAIILSLLIYGCRFVRFKGFIWLAVVYILSALSVFGTRSALSTLWQELLGDSLPFSPEILAPAMGIVLSQYLISGIVLLVLAAVFITAFVFGRKYLRQKQMVASADDFSFPSFDESVLETLEEITETQETTQE